MNRFKKPQQKSIRSFSIDRQVFSPEYPERTQEKALYCSNYKGRKKYVAVNTNNIA